MIRRNSLNPFSVLCLTVILAFSFARGAVAFSAPGIWKNLGDNEAATKFILAADNVGPPKEPEGYRMSHYRAETPRTLNGATVVGSQDAIKLWEKKSAIFIDVLPRPPKPPNLPQNTVWKPKQRLNIPRSIWLPNVGFGKLNPTLETYFANSLQSLSNGKKDASLVFYCLEDCWMSWNAAKRAIGWGYTNVYWYPEGTDGWEASGQPLAESQPMPHEHSAPTQ